MEYTLRILKAKDLFLVTKIIDKIGYKEFKNALKGNDVLNAIKKDSKNLEKIGLEVVLEISGIIISNFDKCENELYALLSNLSGVDANEIKELDLADFTEMVVEVLKEPKNRDFIKVASKLFK